MSLISLASPQAPGVSAVSLGNAQSEASSSIARLSSGSAIVRAADDVAGLSISTSLQTRVTSIRSSLVNTLQASSLLQVADGGLGQIEEILQRLNALSTQANGGTLAETERSFLNLEFQELKEEIDRISESTNFNGVTVLKAAEIDASDALRIDDSIAEKASGFVNFTGNPPNGQRFIVNGLEFRFFDTPVAGNPLHVQRGATTEESVTNLLTAFNDFVISEPTDGLLLSGVSFERANENAFSIVSNTAGELSQNFTIARQSTGPTPPFEVSGGAVDVSNGLGNGDFILGGNLDSGLGANSVQAAGVTNGGGLVSEQDQVAGELRVNFVSNPTGGSIRISNGITAGLVDFTFGTDITIGATLEETIDNAVAFFTEYADSNPVFSQSIRQLEFVKDGQDLVIRSQGVGNPQTFIGNDVEIRAFGGGGAFSVESTANNAQNFIDNGTNSGINTQGIINADFVGQVSGFEADFVSTNRINLSLTVGESTYEATFDTDFTNHQTVRLNSEDGGYLDIVFNADNNSVVDQGDADAFASRVDQAIEGLTFYQERNISSFVGSDLLQGTTLDIRLDDFSGNIIFEEFDIKSFDEDPSIASRSAQIELTINGEDYRSVGDIGETIGAYQQVVIQSLENPERQIIFTNAGTALDIKTTGDADALKEAFLRQLPIGEAGSGVQTINFQISDDTSSQLSYAIETVSTQTLFDDAEGLNIATSEAAQDAFTAIQEALDRLTSRRAYVGALQSQSDYIYSTLESSVISHEAARGNIADVDIALESTAFAQSQVRIQAAIAVSAQAAALRSSVLDLL